VTNGEERTRLEEAVKAAQAALGAGVPSAPVRAPDA
jgi:hypothetical protein